MTDCDQLLRFLVRVHTLPLRNCVSKAQARVFFANLEQRINAILAACRNSRESCKRTNHLLFEVIMEKFFVTVNGEEEHTWNFKQLFSSLIQDRIAVCICDACKRQKDCDCESGVFHLKVIPIRLANAQRPYSGTARVINPCHLGMVV